MMADYTSPLAPHWAASSKKPVEVVGLSKSMGDMSGLNFALLTRYVWGVNVISFGTSFDLITAYSDIFCMHTLSHPCTSF